MKEEPVPMPTSYYAWTPVPTMAPAATDDDNPWWKAARSVEWPEITTTMELTAALVLGLLMLFELKRHRKSVYAPRMRHYAGEERARRLPMDGAVLMGGWRRWPLAWAWLVCRVPDDEMRRMIGLDAFMVLRFLRLWRECFFWGIVFGTVVLAPTYQTGARRETGFYQLTMRNIERGSSRLWAPVCFAYVWTMLVVRLVDREASNYLRWRREYLGMPEADLQAKCSVLLERVPREMRTDEKLAEYFADLFGPAHVFCAVVYLDLRDLEAKMRRRDHLADRYRASLVRRRDDGQLAARLDAADAALTQARERALAVEAADQRPTLQRHRRPASGGWTNAVWKKIHAFEKSQLGVDDDENSDASPGGEEEPALRERFLDDAQQVARDAVETTVGGLASTLALDDALASAYEPSSTGVVTFTDPGTAADVLQLALTSEPLGLESWPAPPPSDVVWRNVGVHAGSIEWRQTVADAGLWLCAFAFSPIVMTIQALSNLEELARVIKPLRPFVREDRYDYARALVTGYIPVVSLLGLLAVIPVFLEKVAIAYVGHKSYAAVQRFVLSRNLYFQLLSIFVTTLAGSLTSVLKEFISHPNSLLALLGRSLPNVAAYFLQTLIAKNFATFFELARPVPYFFQSATRKYRRIAGDRRSEPDRRPTYRALPPDFKLGYQLPSILLSVFIGAIYAPIAPVVLPAAWLYFAAAAPVFARQFAFVYVSTFEAGGAYCWPALTFFSALALIVAQCTLISYISILGGSKQAPCLVPLPLATFTWYWRLAKYYEKPARVLDRRTAVDRNLYDINAFSNDLTHHTYRHPALLVQSLTAADVKADLATAHAPTLSGPRGDDDGGDDDDIQPTQDDNHTPSFFHSPLHYAATTTNDAVARATGRAPDETKLP